MSVGLLTEAQIRYYQDKAESQRLAKRETEIPRTLIIKRLINWQYKEKLNGIGSYKITIMQSDFENNDIFLERNVRIAIFDFRGLITKIEEKDDKYYILEIQDELYHLTRRIYKIADTAGTGERNQNISPTRKEYVITSSNAVNSYKLTMESIVADANLDSTKPFRWELAKDIPTTAAVNFKANWKTHFEILKIMAVQAGHDIWFEDRLIRIGKRGKTIEPGTDEELYKVLNTKLDIKSFGNIVNVVGSKRNQRNLYKSIDKFVDDDMLYKHERVVSNNKLNTQTGLDFAATKVFDELHTTSPDINMTLLSKSVDKYQIEVGDIIKVIANKPSSTIKGFYRVVSLSRNKTQAKLKLQYSKNGTFIPRVSDSLDIIDALMIKIKDLEIEQ